MGWGKNLREGGGGNYFEPCSSLDGILVYQFHIYQLVYSVKFSSFSHFLKGFHNVMYLLGWATMLNAYSMGEGRGGVKKCSCVIAIASTIV